MTLHPASRHPASRHPASRSDTARGPRLLPILGRALRRLVLAAVLSLALLLLTGGWLADLAMVHYVVISLLKYPSSGFLSLTVVLWLLFTVPGVLRALAGERVRTVEVAPTKPPVSIGVDATGRVRLRVPSGTFREMDAEHRREMARALDIPWRDELIHDHHSWAVASLEAAQARAVAARR